MTPAHRADRRLLVAGVLAAVVLAAGSTLTLAAVGGAFGGQLASRSSVPTGRAAAGSSCAAPTLAGTVIDITLVDMGGMMGGQLGRGQMMRGQYGSGPMMGAPSGVEMARILANPATVRAGTVSLRVVNQGAATHELVVLALRAGQRVGTRPVDPSGQVDERGSLGEASRSCGTGEGDGITSGATGWVTLTLPAGRYELICNLPGHYRAGMYTELDVT